MADGDARGGRAGSSRVLGAHCRRRRHELRGLLDGGRVRRRGRAVPDRRRRGFGAAHPDVRRAGHLARLRARRRSRPALRLPRERPVRARARAALRRRQAADRPLRAGARAGRRRPPARAALARRRRALRLGRRPPAVDGLVADDPLRDARPGHQRAASCGPRAASRHVRGDGERAGGRAPAVARRVGGRAAARAPVHHRAAPARHAPDELLGLHDARLPRPARALPDRGGAVRAGRSTSSRRWSRRCTPPASR